MRSFVDNNLIILKLELELETRTRRSLKLAENIHLAALCYAGENDCNHISTDYGILGTSREIGLEEHIRNDLFCVKLLEPDALNQSTDI